MQFVPSGGGNPSGFNINQLPTVGAQTMGTTTTQGNNPMTGAVPSGTAVVPQITSPFAFPANTSGTQAVPGLTPPVGQGPSSESKQSWINQLSQGFQQAGVPKALAESLAGFLAGGAGFNQNVLNEIFAAQQPGIQRSESDILEHFGSMGLGASSPAAIGLGDYLSQVNLNQGQIAAQLYEQSIQNYLSVLLGKPIQRIDQGPGFFTGLGESLFGQAAGQVTQAGTGALITALGGLI